MSEPFEKIQLGMCPMCERNEARMAKSVWGHDVYCCSDVCGFAYGRTAKYAQHRLELAKLKLLGAQDEVNRWQNEHAERARLEWDRDAQRRQG